MPAPSGVSVHVVVKRNDLPKLPAAVHQLVADEIARGAYSIEAAAKQKAPVKTGTLRRSIHTVIAQSGLRATVGPSVSYAVFVEFGTRHMAARPYLRPAYALAIPRIIDNLKRALRGHG